MQQVFSYRANKILFNFLRSNDLQGKVILPANICHDVVGTLVYAGYTLQFVDIDARTLCLDWKQAIALAKAAFSVGRIKAASTPKTRPIKYLIQTFIAIYYNTVFIALQSDSKNTKIFVIHNN